MTRETWGAISATVESSSDISLIAVSCCDDINVSEGSHDVSEEDGDKQPFAMILSIAFRKSLGQEDTGIGRSTCDNHVAISLGKGVIKFVFGKRPVPQ